LSPASLHPLLLSENGVTINFQKCSVFIILYLNQINKNQFNKMSLNETYSTVWVGEYWPDMVPTKNGLKQMLYWNRFSPLLLYMPLGGFRQIRRA
jgi:hypothetical protein